MLRILAFFIAVFSFYSFPQNDTTTTMSVNELSERLLKDSSLVILDVRTQPELESHLGKIDGVINIPLNELEARLSELEDYRNNLIAVICKIGIRSGIATQLLIQNGFNAKNVLGGMYEYRSNGNNNE